MKKILIAAALAGTTVGAQAADLPTRYTKAPAYVAPVYNWSGFYFGVNAGVGFGRSSTTTAIGFPATTSEPSSRLGGMGAVGGGQIGYNWQYGNFLGLGNIVVGVETDIQGAGLQDSRTCGFTCVTPNGFAYDQKLDWFGTVRGRVGLATGPVLTYFTGGFAYGGVKTTVTDLAAPGAATTFDNTRTGWTVGSGVEAALGGNWTGKIEYLYVDLGTQTGLNPGAPTPYAFTSEIREQIFRAGLNYRIGGNAVYAPEPLASWNGFYLGGNFGGATALNRSTLTTTPAGGNNEHFNVAPDGFIGGGQIGYNWQASSWMFGIEADFQGSTQRDSKVCEFSCTPAGATAIAVFDQRMDWFGTVRGRVGYAVGSSLFYATGGLAYGDVKTHVFGGGGTAGTIDSVISHTKTGYAVGGGIESPFQFFGWFGNSWTAKTEYLFVDLGRTTDAIGATGLVFSTHPQEHTLRTGLSYHFNGPVVARY